MLLTTATKCFATAAHCIDKDVTTFVFSNNAAYNWCLERPKRYDEKLWFMIIKQYRLVTKQLLVRILSSSKLFPESSEQWSAVTTYL
ncbi:hypothetical protein L596_010226 [Steinernema carpocapsae]|uniref:Uncharacterized protein n=1 Tax=Steinernema carpocapsae TaxID=34508 RepID=A0A4U5PHP7_STECR|nr:hypothetical protein L596_010226 [Steinernema carpocapsae]